MTTPPRPILTFAALLPLVAVGVAFSLLRTKSAQGAFLYLGVLAPWISAGAVLAVALGMARGEPRAGVQATALLGNLACLALFAWIVLRGQDSGPKLSDTPYFLTLAPVPQRVQPGRIVLAYPAPDSIERAGRLILVHDSSGVVTSLRFRREPTSLRPGEISISLEPSGDLLSVQRRNFLIRDFSDRKWRKGAYLEVRANFMSQAIPTGLVDEHFRRISSWF